MSAVSELLQAGFEISISERGGLLVEPASKLTAEQRAFIKANKVVLLAELRSVGCVDCDDPSMEPEALEERAAILEYEGGLTRDQADRYLLWKVGLKDCGSMTLRVPEPTSWDECIAYCRSLTGFAELAPLGIPV